MFSYYEWMQNEYVIPTTIDNKEKYYNDIQNIEHSFSGRMDGGSLINTFVLEGARLLINAIVLFELGYFDCAYYSLRSAVDISTTMVFLSDMPVADREKYFSEWKSGGEFKMQNEMIKLLSKNGNVFADMKENMKDFFDSAKELSRKLNKYVHKQGYDNLYVTLNHPINSNRPREELIAQFEDYLRRCIGVVAVMRLAADPFPILLMDDEMLYRCFDSITDAYQEQFVDEYIGEDTINAYRKTQLFIDTYNWIMQNEKKNEATFNVLKHNYIDTSKAEEILSQIHLLPFYYAACAIVTFSCNKVVKVYPPLTMLFFFTEKPSIRQSRSFSSLDFKEFSESENKFNLQYDEALISVFSFQGENYFAEHNEELSEDDIKAIETSLRTYEDLICECCSDEELE